MCKYKRSGTGSLPGRRNEDDDEGVAAGCSLLSLFFIFWFDSVRSRPYNLCLLSPSHVLLLLFVFALFSSLYLVCLSFSGLLETVKKMVMLILISVFSACAFLLFSLSFFLPSPGFSFSLICNLPFFRSLSLFSLGSASSFLLVFPLFFSPFVAFFFSLLCFFEKKQRNESLFF